MLSSSLSKCKNCITRIIREYFEAISIKIFPKLYSDKAKSFICHIVAPYKQNALKCACVSTEA